MNYVYGCQDPTHPRREVVHSMQENPEVRCSECQAVMHRIPQAFRFYFNPQAVLLEKLGERFAEVRKEKKYGIRRKHARGEPV